MQNYRVEKENVQVNSQKRTKYHVYRKEETGYVHIGQGTVPGHNASDEKCIEHLEEADV